MWTKYKSEILLSAAYVAAAWLAATLSMGNPYVVPALVTVATGIYWGLKFINRNK